MAIQHSEPPSYDNDNCVTAGTTSTSESCYVQIDNAVRGMGTVTNQLQCLIDRIHNSDGSDKACGPSEVPMVSLKSVLDNTAGDIEKMSAQQAELISVINGLLFE